MVKDNDEKEIEESMNEEVEKTFEEFLPQDYNVPTGEGNYMKLEEGENKFRILQNPILGYELWIGKKPKRYAMNQPIPIEDAEDADIDERTGEPRYPKHFWAMAVYNYNLKKVQILELTQKTILRTIKGLNKSADWGSPLKYDIAIIKSGKSFDTTYEVIPSPPKFLSEEIKEAWEVVKDKININALYAGADPFAKDKMVK